MIETRTPPNLRLVTSVTEGRISATEAGLAYAPAGRTILVLAEKLGELGRGNAVEFRLQQLDQLRAIMEHASCIVIRGDSPNSAFDELAMQLTNLAFTIDTPVNWARRIHFALSECAEQLATADNLH